MGVDIVISPARWLTPRGDLVSGRVVVEDGRIRLLSPADAIPPCPVWIDGSDSLVLPGAIDPHTHFREPGQARKEGIRNGSRAALKGGVTTVLDMPNNRPPITTETRLVAKAARFRREALVNWGLHVMALPRHGPPGVPFASGKIYMARASTVRPVRSEAAIRKVLTRWPLVTVHAEDEAEFLEDDRHRPHHERRPRAAIVRALATLQRCLETVGKPVRLVLCHVSTAEEVAWLQRQKRRGFDVWAETCPHYCVFTQDDYLAHGAPLQVNPPLRTEEDKAALLDAFQEGVIDFVASDHAPHLPAEKAAPLPPSGIGGIEWMTPVMLHLVDRGLLSLRRLHDVRVAAARCFGIRCREGIVDGASADFTIVRRGHRGPQDRVVTRAQSAPYESLGLEWTVHATLVNGRLVYRDGEIVDCVQGKEVIS